MTTQHSVDPPETILREIVQKVSCYDGLRRKQPIRDVYNILRRTHQFGCQLPNYGDDAAIIPWNEGYLLLAADGMMTQLLANEPYAAGKAAVMVTVNDIYAMGGRPIGLVNVLSSGDAQQRAMIVAGIAKGCEKLQVPMLGGHTHPEAPLDLPALSVAILGHAKKLMRSHLAAVGDHILLAVDLQGRPGCRSVKSWDANSGKQPKQLQERLEVMVAVAEHEWSVAAKDVSNAGILGTAAIMVENSGHGAIIDLDALPRPEGMRILDWVLCFQSYGFVLSVPPAHTAKVTSLFEERGISAGVIGSVQEKPVVSLCLSGRQEDLIDFRRNHITGIRFKPGD
ncbi:AIR synthase related protein [Desulfatitalea alkaliphila]|uniref:AIR synthase related protein n=1 Tax=Desulfatitalea alkaliphila TaxID=2929485 RepID=A0AA41R2C9_9BACT|nr:AIR synthase related protein [Desulfatitalea alkaliphila]MCJ8499610.1 AIR synthase related protein [Desulfatitalea alkaliphila]